MTTSEDREEQRVLAFLGRGGARADEAARPDRIVLRNQRGDAIGASKEVLDRLAKRGRIARDGGEIALVDDASDAHRAQRTPGTGARPGFNPGESPLGLLATRRDAQGRSFLEASEVDAGERLRADYTRGQIMPRLGANWSAAVASGRRSSGAGGMTELTDAALAARQRVDHAIDAVGPELAGVLVDVCCFLKGLETVERERRWPARSAKLILKTALAALARHYWPDRRRSSGPSQILRWGTEDFRPSL